MNWVLICSALLFASCQSLKKSPEPASVAQLALKNYISLDLEYGEYQKILNNLDSFLSTKLNNRGEAHITVITPPEFKIVSSVVDASTVHQEWENWPKKSFKQICLGEGKLYEKDQLLKTYYIVVESSDLLEFRNDLKKKYNIKNFSADVFYPHITIGFTVKDLHLEQGVVKNKKSCPKNLQKLLR
jgi:hypothetical protein